MQAQFHIDAVWTSSCGAKKHQQQKIDSEKLTRRMQVCFIIAFIHALRASQVRASSKSIQDVQAAGIAMGTLL
jgi:hypothetical protein